MLSSRSVVSDSLCPHGLQHTRPPCPSQSPKVCSSSCPLHWWCHPPISSSDTFFFFPQPFPARTFLMSQVFASGDQNTGGSASGSGLPMSIQDRLVWSPYCPRDSQESSSAPQFEGINSLALCLPYSPGLLTVRDHWEDHSLDYMDLCQQSNVSAFQHTV